MTDLDRPRHFYALAELVGGVDNLIGGLTDGPMSEIEFVDGVSKPTESAVQTKLAELQAEYDTNQPLKLLRAERDGKLKEEVDPKTCEAYNNGTQLSNEWKNYRQALLDMTLQTPTLDEYGNLKAGLELDEIYWPTKPE